MSSLRNPDQVRDEFAQFGISIAAWARKHDFSAALVYRALANPELCQRGQSHAIAVRLGLKDGRVGDFQDLSFECDMNNHEKQAV